jgi:choline-sulfatase
VDERRPHLVFLFADQQHFQAVGRHDPWFHTPNLDRFAAMSTDFRTAYCTQPLCSPSRSTLMTGRYPHRTGVCDNGLPLREHNIGWYLQRAGYHTAYFGKWHLRDEPIAVEGWDESDGVYDEYRPPNRPLSDAEALARALAFVESRPAAADPTALFVSFDEPHGVYCFLPGIYPDGFAEIPPGRHETPLPRSWAEQDESTTPVPYAAIRRDPKRELFERGGERAWRAYRELYRDRVAAFDRSAGAVLDRLERRGWFENAVIVVSADHGDMDAHHRLAFKGPHAFDQTQRVPLSIYVPAAFGGRGAGVDADSLVSNVDLFPTLMEFAGAPLRGRDGVSLCPVLTGQAERHPRKDLVVEYSSPPIRTLRTARWKYSLWRPPGGEAEELYDMAADPDELCNLADDPAHAETRAALRARLDAWISANDDSFYELRGGARTQ